MNKAFETALKYYGLTEVPDENHNPEILKFFSRIGHSWVQTDETAWCSAFVNYCCMVNELEYSGELDARSWLNVGIKIKAPNPGDIVIFWRENPNSWKGHVGFYVTERNGYIYCLGGNQKNQVNISAYGNERLLGYRNIS